MDVLDTPLNSAHQQGRKADRYLEAGKYEEAIRCHQTAADLLAKTIKTTQVKEALESLTLQQKHHIRQQEIVRLKQTQAALSLAKTNNEEDNGSINYYPVSHAYPAPWMSSASTDTLDGEHEDGLWRTIRDGDSLLTFLNERASLTPQNNPQRNHPMGGQDDAVVIEELRTQNKALQGHIMELLHDLDMYKKDLHHYKTENAQLHARLRELDNGSRSLIMTDSNESDLDYPESKPLRMNFNDITTFELPPLERPEFDIDSLKTNKR